MIEKLKLEQNPLSATVEKIKEFCPAAVTGDGKIDFDALKTALGTDVADEQFEKYEFTWVGKNAAKAEANRPIRKTLRPVVADSRNWDKTQNLYIEGDNLDALKLLQESYLGKVKMIYIDPPYNTGNDFVYCDNFTAACADYLENKGQCDEDGNRLFKNTETNGRFHSDWCSMMYPRLKLARDLLSDDGVIFISIDDHEQANLKKICDEVFGEGNFITEFIWKKNGRAGLTEQYIGILTEYIYLYAKNKGCTHLNKRTISRDYDGEDSLGKYNIENLERSSTNSGYKTAVFPIIDPNTNHEFIPADGKGWMFGPDKAKWFVDTGRAIFDYSNNRVLFKIYESDYKSNENPYLNLLVDIGGSKLGGNEIGDLFGSRNYFSYPKPNILVKHLLEIGSTTGDIILDFFSGSATTAHAVMQLNAEDGGNRRFIMVQLPEATDESSEVFKAGYKNICEIGKERIRRAGDKIVKETGRTDLDIGFRVLRVDSTNMADVERKPGDTTQAGLFDAVNNIKSDRSDLDLLFGVMVDCGLMLDYPIETRELDGKKYYVVNGGDLVACFENDIPEKLIYEIANLKPTCAVFRDSSFADPAAKINLAEIFKNIVGDDDRVKVL